MRYPQHLFGILAGLSNHPVRLLRGPFSQHELSRILKVRPARIAEWENDSTYPHPRTLRALLIHAHSWTAEYHIPFADFLEALAIAGSTRDRRKRPPPEEPDDSNGNHAVATYRNAAGETGPPGRPLTRRSHRDAAPQGGLRQSIPRDAASMP